MAEKNSTLITNWMENPHSLSQEEKAVASDLLSRYPYFVPAHMMQAGQSFASEKFSEHIVLESRLFSGNWLYFCQMMNASVAAQQQIIAEPKASVQEQILDEEETIILDETLVQEEAMQQGKTENNLIQPLYVDNYFQHQGIEVPEGIPVEMEKNGEETDEKSLMVMMGFDEWLMFLKKKNDAKLSDEEDKAIVRSIWQREKLAAAMGEEDDNIPEAVFEMAINSIDKHDIMVSEPLAEIHIKQGRFEKAIEIYKKLSLQNPEKKTYFAAKINHLNKEHLS